MNQHSFSVSREHSKRILSYEDNLASGSTSANMIIQLMSKAQKDIANRKEKIHKLKSSKTVTESCSDVSFEDRQKRIDELRMKVQQKIFGNSYQSAALPESSSSSADTETNTSSSIFLDLEGRKFDVAGREIIIEARKPTLKVNLRLQREMKNLKMTKNCQNYDERLDYSLTFKRKYQLRCHEFEKSQTNTERIRIKNRFEELQREISLTSRRAGITLFRSDNQSEEVPIFEWWDSVILVQDLDTLINGNIAVRYEIITNLIEHPIQTQPPNEPARPIFLPVFLTKQEQKKLRRQNRREAWMAEQEKIRLGLVEPPKAKLKISNMMQVLSIKAIQDPTRTEAQVRRQIAIRQKNHENSNETLKLTTQQRREKNIKKLKDNASNGTHVSVYIVRNLHKSHGNKFKIEINAMQLYMSGVVAMFHDFSVVVVEGGPKQQKRYRRLMMHRIKWTAEKVEPNKGEHSNDACILIWKGKVLRRHFGEFKSKTFMNEFEARKYFQKHHCEHFWDLAYSTSF